MGTEFYSVDVKPFCREWWGLCSMAILLCHWNIITYLAENAVCLLTTIKRKRAGEMVQWFKALQRTWVPFPALL